MAQLLQFDNSWTSAEWPPLKESYSQEAGRVAATTGGEIKQNPLMLSAEVFKRVWLKSSASEAKPNLQYLCVILKAYNYILAPQLS